MKKSLFALASVCALAIAVPAFAAPGAAPAAAVSTPAAASASTSASAPTHLSLTARAQTKLKTLSLYSGPVNGRRDATTIAAIRSFQTQNHLSVNGRIDAPTRRALGV
jgi:peptidoglycan hydrolase-like protein with peptidoglycan-binding domain